MIEEVEVGKPGPGQVKIRHTAIGLNFIDNYSQPNAGFMVVTFKPFDQRKEKGLGARDTIARLGEDWMPLARSTVARKSAAFLANSVS